MKILVPQESSYFSYDPFQSWKVFRLENINENVPRYEAYTVRYKRLQYTKLLRTSKRLDRFNQNLIFIGTYFGGTILQMKQKTKF